MGDKTEQLEHELEKEILSKQCSNAGKINTKMMDELDDVLDDSLEDSGDNDVLSDIEMDEENENDDRKRKTSNLFRYKSQKSWGNADLDDQEKEMKKQLDLLAAQQNGSPVPDPSIESV